MTSSWELSLASPPRLRRQRVQSLDHPPQSVLADLSSRRYSAVLYAASSQVGAIYETLLHDAVNKGSKRMVLPLESLYKHYGTWVTQRELQLAPLHAPDLTRFGLTVDQLTATNRVKSTELLAAGNEVPRLP